MRTGFAGALTLAALGAAGAASAQECDRDCVLEVTDAYVAALAANDPGAAPLADEVAFVENIMRMQPGQGLWMSASGGPTDFQIHVPDPVNQSAGWLGVMEQGGSPVLVAIRLKLEGGLVTEAEHLIAGIGENNLPNLQTPRPGLVSEVPEGARKSHDELVAIGASYYDALDDNDGSLMPFAADCARYENGSITAGPDLPPRDPPYPNISRECEGQLDSKAMTYIDTIDNRRLFAADPVTGLAMGLSHFRHPQDLHPYEVILKDGSTGIRDEDLDSLEPFDLPAAHIFKVGADGLVHEIEAMGFLAPYMAPTGWE